MCTYKNSRHLDRMTRRSDKCDCCVYEYINRKTGGWRCSAYIYIGTDKINIAVSQNPRYHRKGVYITINLFNLCQHFFLPFYTYFSKCWHRLNEPPVLLCEWNITHSFGRKNIFVIYSAVVAHLDIDFCTMLFNKFILSLTQTIS